MSKYKVTRWMQASVPVVSYVEANSSEEAEEESSTAPYNYDYGNAVIGDIEDTEVEEVKEVSEEARPSKSITFKADDGMVELYTWNGVQANLEDQTTSPESLVKTLVDLNIPKDIQIYNTDSIDLASHHGFDSDDDAHNIINKAIKLWSSVKEDSGQDIESDIYAQDTWKNDWRKSEEIVNKYFDGNEDYLEAIMDNVTSDDYVNQTGDDYFWNKHSDIITDNFYGDWNWLEAIQYWDEKDIVKAKSIYSNDFQQTHNLKPGNSTFDNRRRTTESKDVRRLKDLIKYRS